MKKKNEREPISVKKNSLGIEHRAPAPSGSAHRCSLSSPCARYNSSFSAYRYSLSSPCALYNSSFSAHRCSISSPCACYNS